MSATFETGHEDRVIASGVDDEPPPGNQRDLAGWQRPFLYWVGALFVAYHIINLNLIGLETWTFRISHVAGGLAFGFAMVAAWTFERRQTGSLRNPIQALACLAGAAALVWVLICLGAALGARLDGVATPGWVYGAFDVSFFWEGAQLSPFGVALTAAVVIGMVSAWSFRGSSHSVFWADWILAFSAIAMGTYFILAMGDAPSWNVRYNVIPSNADFWVSLCGVLLILELTRRVAGMALVIIASIFVIYVFLAPYLPGILAARERTPDRVFAFLFSDSGILSAPVAVSSTYIILFITFAAFLQASKVGDYFVNFAFAAAGRARGGPAKVAVFASGLMGMINGTSAGNVVATGSLTIPLMKRVGYRPQTSAAVEAAASTGGQIMPPIMGAGAFIMAEVTGIPYTELVVSAIIPAVLYFVSVYVMVDLEAVKMGMRGMRQEELPQLRRLMFQVYLFIPVVILIVTLFAGYSVIRAGTMSMVAAVIVSWLSPQSFRPLAFIRTVLAFVYEALFLRMAARAAGVDRKVDEAVGIEQSIPENAMGWRRLVDALDLAAKMSIQLIAVCACAGIIVGVISLTGIGTKFASLLLGLAEASQLLALVFAMLIAMLLGMGMPTTAAYAVAASVVAPGLQQLGIEPLVAHFFVFYFAVISAITPPVALASYAGAAIAGANPMGTSVTSFKLGLAAYIVPFMFFYSQEILMVGAAVNIALVFVTATVGVYFMASAVQGWFMGRLNPVFRLALLVGAVLMIEGGIDTDVIGVAIASAVGLYQYKLAPRTRAVAE